MKCGEMLQCLIRNPFERRAIRGVWLLSVVAMLTGCEQPSLGGETERKEQRNAPYESGGRGSNRGALEGSKVSRRGRALSSNRVERLGYETKEISKKNLTSYVFSATVQDLHAAIESLQFRWSVTALFKRDLARPRAPLYSEVNLDSIGERDVFLWSERRPLGRSAVYHIGDTPLEFLANFHVRITSIDKQRTQVEIEAVDTEVIVGETIGLFNPHGPANKYVKVQPTTIEEYNMLLDIGGKVGERGMPDIVLPK